MLGIVNMIRPRSGGAAGGGGPSGGGGGAGSGSRSGGGPQRSAAASARTAGRAAAAAYAYRTGDAATLRRLGLDYDELKALGDDGEVARRIVTMACDAADSTIPDHEQRMVTADITEWILEHEEAGGRLPTPDEIVRQTIATIIASVALTENGDLINQHEMGDVAESDVRDLAEALANQAGLSAEGAGEDEISRAIEDGIDTIRTILAGES
ncbi:hypothetical protein JOF35_005142 [Streptomyces demainii]|uniref:TerB family tellurite resistance protein n=2 Tax=Streptomyces demainii TaxID=588122 RepID=A0ABT9KWQ3_9ACTN|nr:hypothetical protein [Streptomyces demainii]